MNIHTPTHTTPGPGNFPHSASNFQNSKSAWKYIFGRPDWNLKSNIFNINQTSGLNHNKQKTGRNPHVAEFLNMSK